MNWFKKVESFDDEKLNSASQQKMAVLVQSLPEEDLSMSWRSSLNVKIMAAEQAKKKQKSVKRIFAWGSSLSAGMAATAYIVLMANAPSMVSPVPRNDSVAFASELVQAHQESVVLASVSGVGSSVGNESPINEEIYTPVDDLL
jgi:hypothetical protein